MGFLKSLGKIARQAAPFASFIPGVGPVAAGVLGAGGAALEGKGLKGAIKGGLGGYVGSSGISGLTGGKGILGVSGAIAKQGGYKAAGINLLKSKLGLGGGSAAPAAGDPRSAVGPQNSDVVNTNTVYNPDGSIASQMPIPEHGLPDELLPTTAPAGAPGGAPSGGNGWLSTGLSWLKQHPDLVLAGGSAILGAKTHADAQKRQDQALGSLQNEYDAKAPLRAMSLNMLTKDDPRLAGISRLFQGSGNPYSVGR